MSPIVDACHRPTITRIGGQIDVCVQPTNIEPQRTVSFVGWHTELTHCRKLRTVGSVALQFVQHGVNGIVGGVRGRSEVKLHKDI
jgi:hypothetical protein